MFYSTYPWITFILLTILRDQTQGVPCGYPGSSQNGRPNRVQEYYAEGQMVTYTCDHGYFLLGPGSRKCTDNGTWTPARIPLCDSRLGGLEESGTAETSSPLTDYPARLAIDGDPTTCSYTGRAPPRWWRLDLGRSYQILSIALTVADPQTEQNLIVSVLGLNGNVAVHQRCASFSGKFASTSVVLSCGGGRVTGEGGLVGRYVHIDDHRKDLNYFGVCEVDILVLRERYECGQPERPVNSYTVRLKPDQVEYRCVAGHRLVGNRRRQCVNNGQWSGHQPLCLEVRCPAPEAIANGSVRLRSTGYSSTSQQAVLGSMAVYTCDLGFTLKAAPGSGTNGSRLCNEDGEWSPSQPPVCTPVDCGRPFVPAFFPDGTTLKLLNGSLTGHGTMARLRCPEGYEPSSGHDDLIRCKGDGTWTKPKIKCLSGLHVASSPVEAAREEPGEAITLGLVLGLVGTILLLTMVLAVLCIILRRRRHSKSRNEANGSSRGSGSLQALYNGPGSDAGRDGGPTEGLYSAPVQPARPVVSVIYDYPRRAPVAVPYPFTPIPAGVQTCSRSPSKENIYEEIALNGGGIRGKTGSQREKRNTKPRTPVPLDPEVLALYAQVDFEKKRLSRQVREGLSGGNSPVSATSDSGGQSPPPGGESRDLPPVPPPPDDVTVQNDIYESGDIMVDNELYS